MTGYILRKIESFGIYDGNDKNYFGLPYIKLTIASEKIPGDVGNKYPQLDFEETYVLNDERGKAIKTILNKITLKDVEMYRHEHSKLGESLVYRYTFIFKNLEIKAEEKNQFKASH